MDEIDELREDIDRIDAKILALLDERLAAGKKIGELKRHTGKPIRDLQRERKVMEKVRKQTAELSIPAERAEKIFREIIKATLEAEDE